MTRLMEATAGVVASGVLLFGPTETANAQLPPCKSEDVEGILEDSSTPSSVRDSFQDSLEFCEDLRDDAKGVALAEIAVIGGIALGTAGAGWMYLMYLNRRK